MTVEHRLGDMDELLPAMTRMVAQHGECLPLVDLVALHQDPLGALGLCTAPESALQVVIFGEAAERDVESALKLLGGAVDDVGEHASLGSLVHERGVVALRPRSRGTRPRARCARSVRGRGSSSCRDRRARRRGAPSRSALLPRRHASIRRLPMPSPETSVVTRATRSSRSFAIRTRRWWSTVMLSSSPGLATRGRSRSPE